MTREAGLLLLEAKWYELYDDAVELDLVMNRQYPGDLLDRIRDHLKAEGVAVARALPRFTNAD